MDVTRDILIIGAGIAGLSAAIRLAEGGRHVTVLAKGKLEQSSSFWAQGGIAAVLDEADSVEAHINDTKDAGAGLTHEWSARAVALAAPSMIEWLEETGVRFTHRDGERHLTREGGHQYRRIVHSDDATGWAVMNALRAAALAHPNITILAQHCAIDLRLTEGHEHCMGADVLNVVTGQVNTLLADRTILATGGASGLYSLSTNPNTSTGDGVAMAWRIGCRIANMEFIQFHPTCMTLPNTAPFLISEALRGEGAVLRLPNGDAFMDRYDTRKELAPRDIVARAIFSEMASQNLDHVMLDISHQPSGFIREHFPIIHEHCLTVGLDITKEPIPVAPAAHYTCGGIVTDPAGRTDTNGLFAVGECAFTGLHGANRLASNSLLEGLVFAARASEFILRNEQTSVAHHVTAAPVAQRKDRPHWSTAEPRSALQTLMDRHAGIVRNDVGLSLAYRGILELREAIDQKWASREITRETIELRNLAQVGELTLRMALSRAESRGAHFNEDHPERAAIPKDSVLRADLPALTKAA